MGKYLPLQRHLLGLRENRWCASFAEIERLVGSRLPASAHSYGAWWSNDASPGRQSHAWLDAGFVTTDVNLMRRTVTFERRGIPTHHAVPRGASAIAQPPQPKRRPPPVSELVLSGGAPVGLVSCVKKKRPRAAAAKDLYISPLFQMSRQLAESQCRQWFILSALHGLVAPDDVIAPYEKTLTTASRSERERWSREVFERFCERVPPGVDVLLLAGQRYTEFLVPLLAGRGHKIRDPLHGLSMGLRLSRLCAMTAELRRELREPVHAG